MTLGTSFFLQPKECNHLTQVRTQCILLWVWEEWGRSVCGMGRREVTFQCCRTYSEIMRHTFPFKWMNSYFLLSSHTLLFSCPHISVLSVGKPCCCHFRDLGRFLPLFPSLQLALIRAPIVSHLPYADVS